MFLVKILRRNLFNSKEKMTFFIGSKLDQIMYVLVRIGIVLSFSHGYSSLK